MDQNVVIDRIKRWQKGLFFHPYTCGNDSRHKPLKAEMRDRVILACSNCDYIQDVPDLFYSEEFEDVFQYCHKFFRRI